MDFNEQEKRSYSPCSESYTPDEVWGSYSPYEETSRDNSTITDSQLDNMLKDLTSDD